MLRRKIAKYLGISIGIFWFIFLFILIPAAKILSGGPQAMAWVVLCMDTMLIGMFLYMWGDS
jgi:hypothetical protein